MSDDLREMLSAAMDVDASAASAEPPAVTTPAPVPEPAAQPAPEAQDAPDGERPRAADGRFAPKVEGAQNAPRQESAPPAGAAVPAQPDLSRPPASLSAPVKAAWATLSPEVQADFVRREREAETAIRERGEKLNRAEPVVRALDPVRQRLGLAGMSDAQYVTALVNADEMLRGPNKLQAIHALAQQYGINLSASQPQAQNQPQPGPPPQGQLPPEVQALRQQVQDLTAFQQRQQAQAQAAASAEVARNIQSFAADPKNLYFANVQDRVAQILQAGQAAGSTPLERLQSAYETACWADPTVRPLLQATQAAGGQVQAAQAAHAQRARGAAVSVTGAPIPGGTPSGAPSAQPVRSLLEAAWDA